MFDLILGLRHAVKGEAQIEEEIIRSWPLFRAFLVLSLCNRYGDFFPWVYPCLGLFCNV
jgi:hypothetical protein